VIPFSPGVLVGCFELMRLLGLHSIQLREVSSSFSRLGGVPIGDILITLQRLNWLQADPSGFAELTVSGRRIAELDSYELRVQAALLDYIDVVRPAWLQNAAYGRLRVRMFAGAAIAQVIDEAGLATGDDVATVAFWDALAARARGLKSDRLIEIGREGERLSIAHERARTKRDPKWVALDNNSDGYDVLSVVDAEDLRPLSIEVKATTMRVGGEFHITANEWQRAIGAEQHVFHLWALALNAPRLTIVPVSTLLGHVPVNNGDGAWESVSIPFEVFA